MAAGDGFGDGAEGGKDAAGVGEAFGEHLHLHELALVGSGQDGARRRQTLIDRRGMLTGSAGGVVVVVWRWGGLRRRSASRASSAARWRARWDMSPSASALARHDDSPCEPSCFPWS